MSDFSLEWLALREAADARARDARLTEILRDGLSPDRPLRIVDLGCGSGANLRYLAPRLGRVQHWALYDRDAALLASAPDAVRAWAQRAGSSCARSGEGWRLAGEAFTATLTWRQRDLATQFDGDLLRDADLVTASALLDLTSHAWIDRLVAHIHARRCAALLVLSYDGRSAWHPELDGDAMVGELLNRHQRRDKGFGPAAGPDAAAYAATRFEAAGYRLWQRRSDWHLTAGDRALQAELARGWAQAAAQLAPARGTEIATWRDRRLACLARPDSGLLVGHLDLLALPPIG